MIAILIEHEEGNLQKPTLEAITFARQLAAEKETQIVGLMAGGDPIDHEDILLEYGVATVYHCDDARLDNFAPDAWAVAAKQLVSDNGIEVVIGSGSDRANEVLARAAVRLDQPLCANLVSVTSSSGDDWEIQRLRWGGTLLESAIIRGSVKLMTVALNSLTAEPEPAENDFEVEILDVEFADNDFVVKIVRRIMPEKRGVTLSDAPVVVSGGRAVGSSEGFEPLDQLAALLDGAVGCSRAVTNEGWRPHADQIGQTGERIAAEMYIDCCNSGASQHMAC